MGKSNERNEEEVKNKSILLKELSNEAVEAAKYKEEKEKIKEIIRNRVLEELKQEFKEE